MGSCTSTSVFVEGYELVGFGYGLLTKLLYSFCVVDVCSLGSETDFSDVHMERTSE